MRMRRSPWDRAWTDRARTGRARTDSARTGRPAGPRATRVVVVLVWAAAAVLAGTVTSWAVTVIGGEDASTRSPVLSQSEVAAALAAQTSAPSASPTPQATATSTPPPVPAPTSDAPSSPAPTAAVTPTHRPPTPTTHPSTQPSTEPVPPPAAGPAEVARTWDVTGGRVDASCRGAQFTLQGATPQDGWSVSVQHAGTDGAEVEFTQGETESKVAATCTGGEPTQITSTDAHSGSGHDDGS